MWLEDSVDAGQQGSLTVLRAKPGKPVAGLICGEGVAVGMHYFRKKSLPCVSSTGTPCSLCSIGIPIRVYHYLPIRGKQGTAAIVEMTSTAKSQFHALTQTRPEKSVLVLKLSRGCSRQNAPLEVAVDFKAFSKEEWEVWPSKCIDKEVIKRSLCRLWELPEWPRSMNETDYFDLVARYLREVVAEVKLGYGKDGE